MTSNVKPELVLPPDEVVTAEMFEVKHAGDRLALVVEDLVKKNVSKTAVVVCLLSLAAAVAKSTNATEEQFMDLSRLRFQKTRLDGLP